MKAKKQRENLTSSAQKIRQVKNCKYKEVNGQIKLRQCQEKNCEDCKKYVKWIYFSTVKNRWFHYLNYLLYIRYKKKKEEEEKSKIVPHQLPKDLRNIVESRKRLKSEFEEYKIKKKESYYGKSHKQGEGYVKIFFNIKFYIQNKNFFIIDQPIQLFRQIRYTNLPVLFFQFFHEHLI